MKTINKIIANKFIDNKIIEEKDTDIFEFGITILLYKVGYILSLIFICSILKRNLISLFLFYVSYISIRKQSGGYHAKNYLSCLMSFLVLYILLEPFINIVKKINFIFYSLVLLLLFIIIYLKSPVDCENKRLLDNQKKEKKKRTLFISLFWLIMYILFSFINLEEYALTLMYSFVCITLMLHE